MRILPETEALESAPSTAPVLPAGAHPRRARALGGEGPGASLGHRDDIQGLRAIAVLLVALGHAGIPFLRGGFIGVDVFFVLSGFLITGLLLAGAGKRGYVSFKEFYARRAKRILPAAALTLIVIDIAADRLLNVVRAKQAVLDSIWAAFFSANVQFTRQGVDYFAQGQPPSPIQHYWSLAVEEQFYLVWPLLLSIVLVGVAVHRRRRRAGRTAPAEGEAGPDLNVRRLLVVIILAGLASLAWSIYHTHRAPTAAYFSTTARAWELALGAALAVGASRFLRVPDRGRALMGWAGILAIGLAAVLFSETTAFPVWAALLPTFGTALVIAAGIGNERSRGGAGGLLGRPPLRYVGDRSYAFYLWHWPVLVIAAEYVGHDLSVGANLLLLAGAFLLSILSYGLIENPIRRSSLYRPIRTSAVLWGASVGLVVLVAMLSLRSIDSSTAAGEAVLAEPLPTLAGPAVGPTSQGSTESPTTPAIPAVVAAVQAARRGAPIPSSLIPPVHRLLDDRYDFPSKDCYGRTDTRSAEQICSFFAGPGKRTIVLIGDSHARQWMPAILWVAERDGWQVVPLVELGCRPASYRGSCAGFLQWAAGQVQSLRPEVVLIGGHFRVLSQDAIRASVDGLGLAVATMKPFAKHVVVIGDPPGQGREPVDCLLARGAKLATCTRTLTQDQVSLYADAGRVVRDQGGAFMDTIGWFCFEQQCPMVVGRTISYRDTDHVTQTYVLELRELFRDAFESAVAG
jgi:peptidoglycan/LPS O-acetylase OafA/YrhL